MPIQWFPGHMNAARKKAADLMARTDLVVEVVDARLPEASSNPMIRELRAHRQRPCLKVLNKADIADPEVTRAWLDAYNSQEGVRAIALSARTPAEVARVVPACRTLAPHRNEPTKPLRLMVMGIPNVGKSTLLNALLKRRVAAVGDEPAVTKQLTTYDLGDQATITDTPGLLWPKIAHDSDGYMLAASHAVGVNAVHEEEVAAFLADTLKAAYPALLTARYRFDPAPLDGPAMVAEIGRRRGCLVKGGGIDLEKAALILLHDYRTGTLGRISLETPASRAAMLAAAAPGADPGTGGDDSDD